MVCWTDHALLVSRYAVLTWLSTPWNNKLSPLWWLQDTQPWCPCGFHRVHGLREMHRPHAIELDFLFLFFWACQVYIHCQTKHIIWNWLNSNYDEWSWLTPTQRFGNMVCIISLYCPTIASKLQPSAFFAHPTLFRLSQIMALLRFTAAVPIDPNAWEPWDSIKTQFNQDKVGRPKIADSFNSKHLHQLGIKKKTRM